MANDHAGRVNTADLTFAHPDGTVVQVFLASCYKDAARTLTPGTQTLSAADAESIFTKAGFDFTMSADIVDRGRRTSAPWRRSIEGLRAGRPDDAGRQGGADPDFTAYARQAVPRLRAPPS